MAVSVAVPDLGEDMVGGLVAEWYRPDGAAVQTGDAVCRIECAFVAFEVEAERAGLLRHRRPAGSIERPGIVLGHILGPGEPVPHEDQSPQPAEVEQPEPVVEAVAAMDPQLQRKPELEFEFNFEPGPALPQLVVVEPSKPPSEGEPETEVEPLEEFEEALIEAVVVPFPRRFAMQPGIPLDEVPGDSVTFETTLFEAPDGEVADSLPVPGGSIPGLALWEPDDQPAPLPTDATRTAAPSRRIAAQANSAAQVSSMSITLDCTEAERMRLVLAREWRGLGITLLFEDIVFRAIAIALHEASGVDSTGALLIVGAATDVSSTTAELAGKSLLESARAREAGGDADIEGAAWQLVSLAKTGITTATPNLEPGQPLGFAIGSPDHEHRVTLTAAYDSGHWKIASMARLLARTREIFDAPYAMLV